MNKSDITRNVNTFLRGSAGQRLVADDRYASFDYCFNYFQSFRKRKEVKALADSANIQMSCLQLGFYLASWGMMRGSTFLLNSSVSAYKPVIEAIAGFDSAVWEVDAPCYTEKTICLLQACKTKLAEAFDGKRKPTDTLVTKIMLGVFGNVPAFDINFVTGFRSYGFHVGKKSLEEVARFYNDSKSTIDQFHNEICTFDFQTGRRTNTHYTRAKVIDMICFVEGERLQEEAKRKKSLKTRS